MCEFCKDIKIVSQTNAAYWINGVEKRIILSNARTMLFRFEEMEQCLTPKMKIDEILKSLVKFCPMCGSKLTETKDNAEMKPIIHAHAIIDWCGDAECSNCGAYINTTEPYCQHCGADLDEPIERED